MATKIVRILTEIGPEMYEYSALNLASQLEGLTANDKLVVEIASNGGSVIEGEKIFTLLRHAPCKVETKAIGLVASIATLVYLGSPNRTALSNARFMIHSPWLNAGNVNSKRAIIIAENLQGEENRLKGFYAAAGIDVNSARFNELFENEIFFTATEARKLGFVKNIIHKQPTINKMNVLQKANDILKMAMGLKAEIKAEMIPVITTDGTALLISSETGMPEVGSAVTYEDGTPCEAGSYMLADGSVITCDEKGIILTVTMDEMDKAQTGGDEITALKAEIEALKAEKMATEKKMTETEAVLAKTAEIVKSLAKVTPTANIAKPKAQNHIDSRAGVEPVVNGKNTLEDKAWATIAAAQAKHGYIDERTLPINIR